MVHLRALFLPFLCVCGGGIVDTGYLAFGKKEGGGGGWMIQMYAK